MIRRIICASGNKGKLAEIAGVLADLDIPVIPMRDMGITEDIPETGTTLQENSAQKAAYVWSRLEDQTDTLVMADDTGLFVDALDGRPGIYSARYAGEGASDGERCAKLLSELDGVPTEQRTAAFRCVIACIFPDGHTELIEGVMEGRIATEPAGANGFGYDPVFYLPELCKTTAELTREEKSQVSHRGKALRAFEQRIRESVK